MKYSLQCNIVIAGFLSKIEYFRNIWEALFWSIHVIEWSHFLCLTIILRWNFNSYLFPALFFIFNICSLYTWITGTYVWDHLWAFKDWWIIKDNTVFHQTQDYRIKEKQHSFGQETGVFTDIRGYSRFVLMFIRSLSNFSDSMQATLTWGAHSK